MLLLLLKWIDVLQLHLALSHAMILHHTIVIHFPQENTLVFM